MTVFEPDPMRCCMLFLCIAFEMARHKQTPTDLCTKSSYAVYCKERALRSVNWTDLTFQFIPCQCRGLFPCINLLILFCQISISQVRKLLHNTALTFRAVFLTHPGSQHHGGTPRKSSRCNTLTENSHSKGWTEWIWTTEMLWLLKNTYACT